MSLPYIGKCVLCGKESEAVNEGICAAHSDEVAQAYLFGFADGKASPPRPAGDEGLRVAAENLLKGVDMTFPAEKVGVNISKLFALESALHTEKKEGL